MEAADKLPGSNIAWDSPKELSLILENRGLAMTKRFGQNFLINAQARETLRQLINPQKDQVIWEIGPGLGALTHHLLGREALIKVFEIDYGFIRFLQEEFGERPDFSLVEGDALKTADAQWEQDKANLACICGNLPYNAASGFIMDCLEKERRCRMVFTVQKEAAERMAAGPGSSTYSSFSVQCTSRYVVKIETVLGPSLFWPAPEVTSAVVSFTPRSDYKESRPRDFNILVRSAFAARRKTLLNNLKASGLWQKFGKEQLAATAAGAGIDLGARAETLEADQFIAWAAALEEI